MKTVWLSIIAVGLVPGTTLAQSAVVAARPRNGTDLRILPIAQSTQASASQLPEPVPPGKLQGKAEPAMTLADLEAMAQANNPVLARAAARVEAARGQWFQVGLPPNPVGGYAASEIGNEGRAGQQGGFVGQEIVTGGKLRLSRAVAAQEIRIAEQQLAAQRFRVLSDVRTSFYEVLVAHRRIEIAQELVRIGERAVEAVERFLQAKEASRVDLLQARVETNSARILLENSRNDHSAAWHRLGAVVGIPNMQPTTLAGDVREGLAEITFEDARQRLLSNSPELAAIQANVSRAQQSLNRARAEPIPNLDVQVGVQHDNASNYDIASVQLGAPIPIWNRNQGGIRRAQAELAAAQNDVRRAELELQQRLASTYQRYANARQQVATYTKAILPDAQASLDLVTKGYQQGEFGYLTLLTSQRTYFQTNLAYLESLRQLRESAVVIDGLLLTDSLRPEETAR